MEKALQEVRKIFRAVTDLMTDMIEKLVMKVGEGYAGWDDPEWHNSSHNNPRGNWYQQFRDHLQKAEATQFSEKSDLIDLLNLIMFRIFYLDGRRAGEELLYRAPKNLIQSIRVKVGKNPYTQEYKCSCCRNLFNSGGLWLRIQSGDKVIDMPICQECLDNGFYEGVIDPTKNSKSHPLGVA